MPSFVIKNVDESHEFGGQQLSVMPTPALYGCDTHSKEHSRQKNGYLLIRFEPLKCQDWDQRKRYQKDFVLSGTDISKISSLDPTRIRYKKGLGPQVRPESVLLSTHNRSFDNNGRQSEIINMMYINEVPGSLEIRSEQE